jgi:putative phosphoesterase
MTPQATPSEQLHGARKSHRIAVFADTHDAYPSRLPGLLAEADELWHLGDVCAPDVLAEFTAVGRPLSVVRGNNDAHFAWPLTLRLERASRVFHLEHIAPRRAPTGVEFVLCGHTHVPEDMTDPSGVRWLNPGCISYPRGQGCSFAWLTIAAAGKVDWKIVAL